MPRTDTDTRGAAPHILTEEEKQASGHRADFMKQFFAVAVSVGFAERITGFSCLSTLEFPKDSQIQEIILLFLSMIIVIGSWDFYFASIAKCPLADRSRFYFDIFIVSIYIILPLSSKNLNSFLFYFSIIMLSYLIWDILSMRSYPEDYGIERFSLSRVIYVFARGISWSLGHGGTITATPFITLWWTLVFLGTFLYHTRYSPNFYLYTTISALIYIIYRVDQRIQLGISWRAISLAVIVLLLTIIASTGNR